MKSYSEYKALLEAEYDKEYHDTEIKNYFKHLIRKSPSLALDKSDLSSVLSQFWKDENSPRYDLDKNNDADIRKVIEIAREAKQEAKAELTGKEEPETYALAPEEKPADMPASAPEREYEFIPDEEPDYYDRMISGLKGAGLTKQQVSRIKRLARTKNRSGQSRWTAKEIAERMGIDVDDVEAVLERGSSALNSYRRRQIKELAAQGQTAQDIAFHLDMPAWKIQKYMDTIGQPNRNMMPYDQFVADKDMEIKRPYDRPYLGDDPAMEKEMDRQANLVNRQFKQGEWPVNGPDDELTYKRKYSAKMSPTQAQIDAAQRFVGSQKPTGHTYDDIMSKGMDARRNLSDVDLPPEMINKIHRLHANAEPGNPGNWSDHAIAMELGVPLRQVRKVLKGLPIALPDTRKERATRPQSWWDKMWGKLRS